jgi:hypothetical protein
VHPHVDQVVVDEVTEQDADDAQRQAERGCQVGHGDRRRLSWLMDMGSTCLPVHPTTSIRSKRSSTLGRVRPPVTV